jgi:hypothetical protein
MDDARLKLQGDTTELDKALEGTEEAFGELGEEAEKQASIASKAWEAVKATLTKVAETIQSIWDRITEEIANAFTTMIGKIKTGLDAFIQTEAQVAKLTSTLRATRNAMQVTTHELEGVIKGMRGLSVQSDESVRSAAMVMLQFRNVRGDIFKDAIRGAMNLAAITGDMSSAARDFGEKLNDPIVALREMHLEGDKLTKVQQRQLQYMININDKVGIQRMLMQKLADLYGGAATREMKTFAGQAQLLQNAINRIFEAIGSLLVPTLMNKFIPVMEKAAKIVEFLVWRFGESSGEIEKSFDKWIRIGEKWAVSFMHWALDAFSYVQTLIMNWDTVSEVVWGKIKEYALSALMTILDYAIMWGGKLMELMQPVFDLIVAGWEYVVEVAMVAWTTVSTYVMTFCDMAMKAFNVFIETIGTWVEAVWGFAASIMEALEPVLHWFYVAVGVVAFVGVCFWEAGKMAVEAFQLVVDIIQFVIQCLRIATEISMIGPRLAWTAISALFRLIMMGVNFVAGGVRIVWDGIMDMIGMGLRGAGRMFDIFGAVMLAPFRLVWTAVKGLFGLIFGEGKGLFSRITDWFAEMGKWLTGKFFNWVLAPFKAVGKEIDELKEKFKDLEMPDFEMPDFGPKKEEYGVKGGQIGPVAPAGKGFQDPVTAMFEKAGVGKPKDKGMFGGIFEGKMPEFKMPELKMPTLPGKKGPMLGPELPEGVVTPKPLKDALTELIAPGLMAGKKEKEKGAFGAGFDAQLEEMKKKNAKLFDSFKQWDKITGDTPLGTGKDKMPFGRMGTGLLGEETKAAGFEDLLSLNKRITGAAAKPPEVAAIDKQTAVMERHHFEQTKLQKKLIEQNAEKTTKKAASKFIFDE